MAEIDILLQKHETISKAYTSNLEKSENQALINILPKKAEDSTIYYFITFTGLFAFYLLSIIQTNFVIILQQ